MILCQSSTNYYLSSIIGAVHTKSVNTIMDGFSVQSGTGLWSHNIAGSIGYPENRVYMNCWSYNIQYM